MDGVHRSKEDIDTMTINDTFNIELVDKWHGLLFMQGMVDCVC